MALLNNVKNFAKVIVSIGYNAAATSIVLNVGQGALLPVGTPFNVVWWNSTDYNDPSDDPNVEIVRVTNISTDTLTVTRAQEGTSASTKNTASKTYRMIAGLTAKGPESLQIGSGANNTATNILDIRGIATGISNIHFATTDTDTGSYMTSVPGGASVWCVGAVYDGTNFTARETTASVLQINAATGIMKYFRDIALTPGNTYSPTIRFTVDGSGNIGALGVTPNTALDTGLGSLSVRKNTMTLVNGLNSNITTTTGGLWIVAGPSAGFSLGGFTGGIDGRLMIVLNDNIGQVMTIVNQDASSSAGNKIATLTGGNVAIGTTHGGGATFIYDGSLSVWILTGTFGS